MSLTPYRKLLRIGVPEEVVRQRMVADRVAPEILAGILGVNGQSGAGEDERSRQSPQQRGGPPGVIGRSTSAPASMDGRPPTNALYLLLLGQNWEKARSWCREHPEDASYVDCPGSGRTPLHNVCVNYSAPFSVLIDVLRANPAAAAVRDNRGDTPLHLQCRISQKSALKVLTLLQYGEGGASLASIPNRSGQTPLHAACDTLADLPVLRALVAAHPAALEVADWYGNTPLAFAWKAYTGTIPGGLKVGGLLNGKTPQVWDVEGAGHFGRFWERIQFLAVDAYARSNPGWEDGLPHLLVAPQNSDWEREREREKNRYLAHALLSEWHSGSHAPLLRVASPLMVALALDPTLAAKPDSRGNYPLHVLAARRKSHPILTRTAPSLADAVAALLMHCPHAARCRNMDGRAPLHLAIEARLPWEGGLALILQAAPSLLGRRDPATCLYPFMLAAAAAFSSSSSSTTDPGEGGGGAQAFPPPSLDAIFQLLRSEPGLVALGIPEGAGEGSGL